MTARKIEVLVAEDSAVTRTLLVHLLEADPQIRVVGAVGDGEAAVEFVKGSQPDVVLMDIHMPRMDGFDATRRIMETRPVPIVICSAISDPAEMATVFRSLDAGAVACIAKPALRESLDFATIAAQLVQTIKLMSEIRVVRRWPRSRDSVQRGAVPAVPARRDGGGDIAFVGIGASTGGPPVLQTILAGLGADFPVPLLVVQHIARGFLPGLAEWLTGATGMPVRIALHGAEAQPGHAYLAPDDVHMGVAPGRRIVLSKQGPENGVRPAVSFLFRSLAQVCGARAVGVLLTGMGQDGAAELKLMNSMGAVTIAQDRASSVVYGMPRIAVELGATTHVLPPQQIAPALRGVLSSGAASQTSP